MEVSYALTTWSRSLVRGDLPPGAINAGSGVSFTSGRRLYCLERKWATIVINDIDVDIGVHDAQRLATDSNAKKSWLQIK